MDTNLSKKEKKIEKLEGDYQRIIKEILECDPIPASKRADDRLEPPWEVVKRIRERVKELRSGIEKHKKAIYGNDTKCTVRWRICPDQLEELEIDWELYNLIKDNPNGC